MAVSVSSPLGKVGRRDWGDLQQILPDYWLLLDQACLGVNCFNGSHTWFLVDHSAIRRLQALQQARSRHRQRQEEEVEEVKVAAAARTLGSEAWHTS